MHAAILFVAKLNLQIKEVFSSSRLVSLSLPLSLLPAATLTVSMTSGYETN